MATSQKNNSAGQQIARAALEQRARAYLADRRFRKAREELKVLCKIDRAKYFRC